MSRLDSTLIEQADELDRLCGYAVRMLGRHRNAAVLDLLGMLDGDRIVALYYALPPARRHATLGDSTWAYYVGRAPEDTDDALAAVADLAERTSTPWPAEAERFDHQARRYRAGLSHDLSSREIETVERARETSRALLSAVAAGTDPDQWLAEPRGR